MNNILEISQMIDLLEDHFSPSWGSNQCHVVGGILGTAIFKHAIHACMKYYNFKRILIVDGCQDYIGLLRKPLYNYVFYMDLFQSYVVPSIEKRMHPFHHFLDCMDDGIGYTIDEGFVNQFDAMIVQNAHYIPSEYMDAIQKYFYGKILCIVDPLDLYGEIYDVPTLYDSLSKQTSMVALARSMFGIDTRSIDRKIKCDFKKVKMYKRSVGKIDVNQYVSNSDNVVSQIRDKQSQSQFRRNQKFIIKANGIMKFKDQNDNPVTIGNNVMCSITTVSKPLMKLRIHSSARQIFCNLTYRKDAKGIYVQPANIISLKEACLHRFNSVVYVLGEAPMTNRQWYSLMKIANHISVTDY